MERKITKVFKAPPLKPTVSETRPRTEDPVSSIVPNFNEEPVMNVINTIHSKYDAPGEIELGREGRLLQEFLQYDGLTKQIIDAYDYWISDTLARRLQSTVIHFSLGTVKFEDITIMEPTMILPGTQTRIKQYPHNARRDKTTYSISIYATMKFYPKGSDGSVATQEENFKIGEIPVILGSRYCNLYGLTANQLIEKGECDKDPLAYFIIEGQEKIVLQHDKLRFNKPFIFPKDNKKPNNGMFEESVNLNSKKIELSMIICRFTAMPTLETPMMDENKVFSENEIDPKKSTVVNLYYDLKTKALMIKLDRFIQDTYLNVFYLYELYGITDMEVVKKMILKYVSDIHQTKIMTFLNKSEMDYRMRQDIIGVLKGVMKLPEKIEKLPTQKHLEYYQEKIGDVFFKQTEGPVYDTKQDKYNAKIEMLSIMIARFSEYQTNCRESDHRDSWSNKRVVSAGPAMEHLFNQIWNSMIMELNEYLSTVTVNERTFEISGAIARIPTITIKDTFVRSFNPNTWGIQQSIMKENMTDFLKNETLLSKYSQILKISPETSDKGKQTSIREVNFTQTGYICPIETPEGKQCGIVKGLAVGCYISIGRDENVIVQYVRQTKMITHDPNDETRTCAFILNGKFIGWCEGRKCESDLKKARRSIRIHRDTMIHFEEPRILWVYCDGGRPTRPLLIVNQETGRLVIEEKNLWDSSFYELLKQGAVEYIDALEQEFSCVIAQKIDIFEEKSETKRSSTSHRDPESYPNFNEIVNKAKYTHCELDPNSIISLVASIIPMPDRSQAPRNTYQTSMGKQALSIQNTNAINRFDTEVKSLAYPSPTLFETQMYKYIGLDELPIGETVMVAIMSYGGWNQEDSIIINQAAVDRGRFRIVRTITYKTIQLSGNKDFVESIQKPIKKVSNADSLDEDGVVKPGTYVRQGDCLIGKVKKILRTREMIDASVYVGVGDSGIVERVLKTTSAESRKIVMVKIREVRKIRAGDKCACYVSSTDILTKNRGWISIKDVKTDDLVASLVDGMIQYVHPEATQEYDYEGDMYKLTSNQVDLMVTPNHNLYVKKRTSSVHQLVRADEAFGKRVNHKKNAKNNTPDQEFFILPGCTYQYKGETVIAEDKRIPMNAWLKLFGIWNAEGCANEKHIKICGHKQRVRDVLDEIESDLGIQFSTTRDKKYDENLQCIYYILDRQFCSYFDTLSVGAVNKKLPQWCFELSEKQSQILLTSMVLGDGHISKNNCVKYYTSSKQLVDDVQVIALHSGWSANSKKRYDAGHTTWCQKLQRYITTTTESYDLTIVMKKNEPQVNHGHKKSQKGQKEEWVSYNGKVYCCTVPSGVIYIRHNNKPVWCGNSRYAQKGTIGIVMPAESMPVVMSGPNAGMMPDIIINSHSIPSRMTVGKMIEIMTSKVAAMTGKKVNATAFRKFDLDAYSEELSKLGFDRHGSETMMNGMTGEMFENQIFMGPCYYQALKHHVQDKIQQRGRGPVKITTRQPTAGRTKGGGIRVGEMERDGLLSHGATSCQKEKTFDHSDAYRTLFCKNCGSIANIKKITLKTPCQGCSKNDFGMVSIPYSYKVLVHELCAASMQINLKLKEKSKILL